MKKWPTDPVNVPAPVAPQAPEGSPSVPDLGGMNPEEIEAKAAELEGVLRAARSERDGAAVDLATARGGLVAAAGRGFEAAKAAQRAIAEEEERLRTAELVTEAVEAAHRPIAAEAHRLSQIRTRERFALAQDAKIRERDGIDQDLIAAIDTLGVVAARRERATAEALEIKRTATQSGHGLPHFENGYTSPAIRAAIERLPLPICRAIAS